ncbi:MAG: succinate dehydrogenase cytochrome b subunit [Bryobacteraceae bacterium]|nr:succinate dehydrogenase cytochrome b subunit [Bryobacteraceae bacterium]
MSAMASTFQRTLRFYEATIGKKALIAVTGAILVLYVVGHMIGNLQIYLGREALNAYAHKLHDLGPLLWLVRGFLLLAVVVHIVASIQLWLMNRAARPSRYVRQSWVKATFASRTMIVTGPILAAFIVYHVLHLTVGRFHPGFNHELDVYHNVVAGFRNVPTSVAYIVAMALLGYHVSHGAWSMFQSAGLHHPRYMPIVQKAAVALAIALFVGNISIPISILAGFIR